jgi:hypothetical protein
MTIPIYSALFAFVWVYTLTERDNIFGWWPRLSDRLSDKLWFRKISYECEKCIAGQLSLWWSVMAGSYDLIIVNIITAIALTMFIGRIYNKLT